MLITSSIESPRSAISDRKLQANRENAANSTGPKSETGKLASSRNNLRHGLTGSFTVLPDEDDAEFHRMQKALINEHEPATETESQLIEDMARHYWLFHRALRLQDECFFDDLKSTAVQNRLSLYLRYGTTHERNYSRCLHDFLKLRKEKLRLQRGFESQEREKAAEIRREAAEQRREAQEIRREATEKRTEEAWQLKKNEGRDHVDMLAEYVEDKLSDEFKKFRAREAKKAMKAAEADEDIGGEANLAGDDEEGDYE